MKVVPGSGGDALSKPLECPLCDEKFVVKRSVGKHLTECHAAEDKIQCPTCDESLSPHYYITHLDLHESSYKKFCPICHKGFLLEIDLEGHLNMHNGVKPFVCHICQSAYAYNKTLQRHIKKAHCRYGLDVSRKRASRTVYAIN